MEAKIPGLGGVFMDSAGRAVIYLKDLSTREAAVAALAGLVPAASLPPDFAAKLAVPGRVVVRQGQYSFSELVAWSRNLAASGLTVPGFVSLDADEGRNRVNVGVASADAAATFMARAHALDIPDSALVISVVPRIHPTSSLTDRVRPTGSGLEVNIDGVLCSLGFNVDVAFYAEEGFLTAGHCDGFGGGGGITNRSVYQAASLTGNTIGITSINPPWNLTSTDCGGYTLCTDADVLYAHSTDTTSSSWAKRIYSTTTWGSGNSPGSRVIAGNYSNISVLGTYVGMTVYKVGYNTGVTSGTVQSTCATELVDSTTTHPYVVLCAQDATIEQGKGDSGGAVFYPAAAGGFPPYALGIMWGGSGTLNGSLQCTANCHMFFSDWFTIESHLSRSLTP